MSWNYRVYTHEFPDGDSYVTIHEAYYNDDGSVSGYTERAISPMGTDVNDLRLDLLKMLEALDKPVLTFSKED